MLVTIANMAPMIDDTRVGLRAMLYACPHRRKSDAHHISHGLAPQPGTVAVVSNQLQTIPIREHVLTIERHGEEALIRLHAADGSQALTIELGPAGPVLRLGTGLAIAVDGELSFAAQRVDIRGHEGVELHSGGDITLHCEGDIMTSAREQVLEARLGDVRVDANDDVKLRGERIRLNC